MPVVYIPGDGTYYVVDDGYGHVTKEKIGGIDPTQEPGYVRQSASSSTSSSTSTSYQDPAVTATQRAQLAEQIRKNDLESAQWQQQYDFNADKARVEEQRGNKQLAIQAQQLAEQIGARIERSQLERTQMAQRMQQFDTEIAMRKQESLQRQNESAIDRTARANEGIASRNLSREQMAQQERQSARQDALQRDRAIAEYAREPGDVGAVSAMLNRGGFSNLSTAIGNGESAITDRSLEPLASLLAPPPVAPQQQMETPIQNAMGAVPPGVPPGVTDVARWQADMAKARALAGAHETAMAAQPKYTPAPPTGGMSQDQINTDYWRTAGVPEYAIPKAEHGGIMAGEDGMTLEKIMQMAQMMGMTPKAIAGDSSDGKPNEETVWSAGPVAIMPNDAMPKMAEGGMVGNDLLEQARQFMARTGQTALSRSGFGAAPTPVSLADPGTSGFRRTLGAATAATTTGIPQSAFLDELIRLIPQGMNRGAGRTR